MAVTTTYQSRYPGLGFYVKGNFKRFTNGQYVATTKDEVAVLDKLPDVTKVEAAETPAPPAQ